MDSQRRSLWTDTSVGIAIATAVLLAAPKFSSWIGSWTDAFVGYGLVAMWLLTGIAAGFSTCMATVWGVVLAISAHRKALWKSTLPANVVFHVWRLAAFAGVGALLGAFGFSIAHNDWFYAAATFVTIAVLVRLGLATIGWFPNLRAFSVPSFIRNTSRFSNAMPATVGVMTVLLPCWFTLAMQLAVARSGDPFYWALAMFAFALGTLPWLALLSWFVSYGGVRKSAMRIAGWLMLAFAGIASISLYDFVAGNAPTSPNPTVRDSFSSSDSVLEVRIVQRGNGYDPKVVELPAGSKIRLTVVSENPYTCAADFSIPRFGIRQLLVSGENSFEIETPKEPTDIWFWCGMRMYQWIFKIR